MSKTAEKITQELAAVCFLSKGNYEVVRRAIDRALEGKIISKRELDALRKDFYAKALEIENLRRRNYLSDCGYQSAIADLNGARSENLKLTQENTNLKVDIAALKMYSPQIFTYNPQYVDWGFGTAHWSTTTYTPGQVISTDPCDICGIVDPPNATHGHSDFEKFVRRLKFWR